MIKVQFDLRDATDDEILIANRLIDSLENSVSVDKLKVKVLKKPNKPN